MSRRLLVSYLALAIVVLALLEIPLGISYARNERHDLSVNVERDAVALASLAEDALEQRASAPPALTRLARRYQSDTGGRVIVVDAQGRALVDSESQGVGADFSTRPEIAAALDGTVATGTRHSRTLGTDLLYVAVPVASGGVVHGAARITYPTSEVDERVRRYWLILAAIAAVVLAVAVALAGGFARWIVRPLSRVDAAAGEVAGGNLAVRVPAAGPPELRRLAGSFNEMVAKLASAAPLARAVRRRCFPPAPHPADRASPAAREPRPRRRVAAERGTGGRARRTRTPRRARRRAAHPRSRRPRRQRPR